MAIGIYMRSSLNEFMTKSISKRNNSVNSNGEYLGTTAAIRVFCLTVTLIAAFSFLLSIFEFEKIKKIKDSFFLVSN